jgi:hypothetical protein
MNQELIKSEISKYLLSDKKNTTKMLQVLITYINQYKNITINNILKDSNINNSDHFPKIIDLFYGHTEIIQETKIQTKDDKILSNGYYPALGQLQTNKTITLILPSMLAINDINIFYEKLCEIYTEPTTLILITNLDEILITLSQFTIKYNNIILIINKNFTTVQMKIISDHDTDLPMIDVNEFKKSKLKHYSSKKKIDVNEYNIKDLILIKGITFNTLLKELNKYCNIYITNISISSINYYDRGNIINSKQNSTIYDHYIIWYYILLYIYNNKDDINSSSINNYIINSYNMGFTKLLSLGSYNLLN